jgi:predicted transcriptional regulator
MRLTTAEREERLAQAIDFYNSHNRSESVRKVAAKFKVSQTTLNNRIHDKHGSIASNSGLNRLLAIT